MGCNTVTSRIMISLRKVQSSLTNRTHYSREHSTEGEIQVYLANMRDLFQLPKKQNYGTAL